MNGWCGRPLPYVSLCYECLRHVLTLPSQSGTVVHSELAASRCAYELVVSRSPETQGNVSQLIVAWWCYMLTRSGSTLAQIMTCCLTAPSHYLNKCLLIIRMILCHSPKGNSTGNAHEINHCNTFENCTFKIKALSPMAADDLATQGARASAAMVLSYHAWNCPAWARNGIMISPPVRQHVNVRMSCWRLLVPASVVCSPSSTYPLPAE